ncbi:hypothetical protein B0H19DRAFT_1079819 [Mycena capillaripes]|nr:hypothetical protein B0H19DRAFT_1079819 [Mycena capillaripes]
MDWPINEKLICTDAQSVRLQAGRIFVRGAQRNKHRIPCPEEKCHDHESNVGRGKNECKDGRNKFREVDNDDRGPGDVDCGIFESFVQQSVHRSRWALQTRGLGLPGIKDRQRADARTLAAARLPEHHNTIVLLSCKAGKGGADAGDVDTDPDSHSPFGLRYPLRKRGGGRRRRSTRYSRREYYIGIRTHLSEPPGYNPSAGEPAAPQSPPNPSFRSGSQAAASRKGMFCGRDERSDVIRVVPKKKRAFFGAGLSRRRTWRARDSKKE